MPVQNFVADLVRKEGGGAVYCAAVFDNHDIGDHCEHDDSDENEENRDDFFLQNSTWHLYCFDFCRPCHKNEQVSKSKLLLDDEDDNDVEFDDGDDDLDNDGGRIDYGDSSDDGEDRGLQVRCYFSVLSSELDGNLVVQLN